MLDLLSSAPLPPLQGGATAHELEHTGWDEDESARLTGRLEVRPAAELGPTIVCLDTSGALAARLPSMAGLEK